MSAASTPPNHERYVNFDEYVEFQLDKTRKSIKSNDLLAALAAAFAILLGLLLTFVVLDHWVIAEGFSVGARWCWFLLLISACCGWTAWTVIWPSLRRVNRLFAARELEHASPALGSNLLNWVDLRDAGRSVHPSVLLTMEKRAATQLSKLDVAQAVDHRPLLLASYALLSILILFCGYALFSPKKISSALWRIVPFARAHAVTRTEIREVAPGDATLLLRGRMDVSVVLAGEIPETVQLLYTTADGRIQDEAMQLRPESTGSTRFRGLFAGENGTGVLQDFSYVIVAGDAHSTRYRVTVHQPPSATVRQVDLHFPPYMKLEDAVSTGGKIEGWEGAEAVITATSDKPAKSAVMQFLNDPQSPPTGEEIPVTVTDGTNLRATWKLDFRSDGTFPKHYRIQCRNEAGEVDPSPVSYDIVIRPDRPPEVALMYPERDLEAASNAVVPLLIQASDPDFELGYINVLAEKDGQSILREPLSDGRQQRVTLKHNLELEPLHLKPGEEIEFWVEAFDNKQPRRNRKNTPRLKIKIEQPVSKQQAAEQLAEEQQQRDQRLAEANEEQERREGAQARSSDREDDAESGRDQSEREESERAEQPSDRPDQPQDEAPQNKGTESAEQRGQGQAARQSSQPGKQGSGDPSNSAGEQSPEKAGETPLSPEGEDDDEALRRLNQRLNQKREPPAEDDDDAAEQQEKRPDPRPESKGSESGEERSSGGNSGEKKSGDATSEGNDSKSGESSQPMPNGEAGAADKTAGDEKSGETRSKPASGDPKSKSDPSAANSSGGDENGEPQDQPGQTAKKGQPQGKDGSGQKPGTAGGDSAEQNSPEKSAEGGQPMNPPGEPNQKNSARTSQNKTSPTSPGKQPAPDNKSAENGGESSESGENKSSSAGEPPQNQAGKNNPSKTGSSEKRETGSGNQPGRDGKPSQQPGGSSSDSEGQDNEQAGGDASGDQSGEKGTSGQEKERSGAKSKSSQNKSSGKSSGEKSDPSGEDGSDGSKTERNSDGSENRRPGAGTASDDDSQPSKMPSAQKNPQANATKGDQGRENDDPTQKSPAAKQNSDGDPEASDEEMKGPGRKEGQRADQPQGGEAGGSKQDKQGKSGSKTQGPGEKSSTPGKDSGADEAEGDAGSEQGQGQGSQSKPGGEQGKPGGQSGEKETGETGKSQSDKPSGEPAESPSGNENAEGSESGQSNQEQSSQGKSSSQGSGSKPSKSPGNSPSNSPKTSQDSGGSSQNDGTDGQGTGGEGGHADATPANPEEANLEYNRQAAELVLQRVRDDLNNDRVDPKLLDDLGWTPDQLKRFTDRLAKQLEKSAGELTPQDEARRRQFEEMLKSLDLKSGGAKRSGENSPNREIDQSGVRRAPVPQDYKASWEAFTRSLSKANRPAPKRPDAASNRR